MANQNLPALSRSYDPDFTLIQSMAAGNTPALDALYARHASAILSYLMARLGDRQSSEEILQDVMLAAWKHAGDFRGESSVRTWLLVIARNRATNSQRRQSPPLITLDEGFEVQSNDTEPLERIERKSKYLALREALNHLPAPQREVLILVFFQQLSGSEAAEVLGITTGTVKSRLHRAKEALRRVLHSEGTL